MTDCRTISPENLKTGFHFQVVRTFPEVPGGHGSRCLDLPPDMRACIISMALFVSGVAAFIQVKKFSPIGSGIRIIASSIVDRRGILIMAIALGLGPGAAFRPEILGIFPSIIKQIFGSAITTGGSTAIFLNMVLPRSCMSSPRTGMPILKNCRNNIWGHPIVKYG